MGQQNSKEEYRDILEDVCSEYCEQGHYCILKEFLVSSHPSPRILLQLKCIDKFKMEESKRMDKDVGWQWAMENWVSEGYAKKFGDYYEDKIKFSVLYKKIRNGNNADILPMLKPRGF